MPTPLRKLAIVGASARAAAFSALRAGYEVVCADLFADADLARFAPVTRIDDYPDGLADWLAATQCDAWMYTGALENHPELVDRMAALRPLLGNGGDVLRGVRDPLELQAALIEAGVRFPETSASGAGLPLDGSWLCKTYRGASGSGVWTLDGPAALERAERDGAVFQRRVAGVASAAIFNLTPFGILPFGVTHQLLGARVNRPWQYFGSMGPIDPGPEIRSQLAQCATTLATHMGLRGLVGIDFVLDGDQAWIVEVNPRYTASVEVFEHAISFPTVAFHALAWTATDGQEIVDLARRSSPELRHGVFAKIIVFATRDATITSEFTAWALQRNALEAGACELADIPKPGDAVLEGRPVLTVFVHGATGDDCERGMHAAVAEVERRLYDE